MAVIGKIEMQAERDVAANGETRLLDLFSFSERSKPFVTDVDIKKDETKLKVHVDKVGILETTADLNIPKGFNANLATLMKWADESKTVKVLKAIKKDESLAVMVEV